MEPLSSGGPSIDAVVLEPRDDGLLVPQRRAYFSKFLIASSGPDQQLGIAQVAQIAGVTLDGYDGRPDLILENQAAQATLNRSDAVYQTP